LTERQQAEEAAYLAKKDTKERPPTHIIDRERKSIDWKSLRHKGTTTEVIEELMRMSTKNLKNPNDAPKRPMNGEYACFKEENQRADISSFSLTLLAVPTMRSALYSRPTGFLATQLL